MLRNVSEHQPRLIIILLALLSAIFVELDAEISKMLPAQIWKTLHIEDSSLKVSLIMPIILLILTCITKLVGNKSAQHIGIALIFIAAQTGGLKVGRINGLDVVTLGILVYGVALHLKYPETSLKLSSLFFFALALQALNLLTLIHQSPLQHIIGAIGLFKMIILAFLLVQIINSDKTLLFATQALVFIALLSSLVALCQAVLYYLFNIDITFIDHLGGSADTHFKPTPFGMLPRASAFNTTAQHLSSFLIIALPFTLFEHNNPRLTKVKLIKVLLLLAGILATWNFGGIFAAVFIIGIYPYVRWPNYIIHILFGMMLLGVLAYYSGILEWVYAHSFGDSGVAKGVDQRHTLLTIGLETLFRLPFVGEGLRGFAENSSGNYWHRPVHNAYAQSATEIGILGAIVFVGMILTKLTQLAILSLHLGKNVYLFRATLLALLGLCLLMFSEPMLDHSNTWILLGFAEALIVGHANFRLNNKRLVLLNNTL